MSIELLPPGIVDDRTRAFAQLMDRLEEVDRTALLTYRIDSVPAAALYALAWQFDVLGLAGWDLAHTTAERRALIKRAIELHKFRGTAYAIEHALDAVGYADAVIEEGIAAGFDHWAKFRVRVRTLADETVPLGIEEQQLISSVVQLYKNARSVLVELAYDVPDFTDAATRPGDLPMEVLIGDLLLLDGGFILNGSVTLSGAIGSTITVA